MSDAFFTHTNAASAAQVQAFFERNPYGGRRSFLADERVGGRLASAALVDVARANGISPIVLVARMQVEKGLINKTSRPSAKSVDYAFGCGCHDNRPCNTAFKGLDKQLDCAAKTMRKWFDKSADGSGIYVRGRSKRALDGTVTPSNHATASLYAYTPWIGTGSHGNWLVWNVTRKHAAHFQTLGSVIAPPGGANAAPGANPPAGGGAPAWIGTPCDADAQCGFGGGVSGVCTRFAGGGICTVSCEGLCPDRTGEVPTFCVDSALFGRPGEGGRCTERADARNSQCGSIPGMVARSTDRYVGSSSTSRRTLSACVPAQAAPAPAQPADPAPAPADPAPVDDSRADDPFAGSNNDACGGITEAGTCQGTEIVYCEGGQVARWDCASEGNGGRCEQFSDGADCVFRAQPVDPQPGSDPQPAPAPGGNASCGGVDCGQYDQLCGNGASGPACEPSDAGIPNDARCATLGFEGACEGDVAVYCADGAFYAYDCRYNGTGCAWGDDGDGYWCR
jgi:hypothetical protein